MSIFNKWFGKSEPPAEVPPTMPWDQHPSIYEHVQSHVDPAQSGLTEGGEALPDDARIAANSQVRWAAGALDGVMTHHMQDGDNEQPVRQAVDLVRGYCDSPIAQTKLDLYQHIIDGNTLPLIDAITEALIETEGLNHQRLYELAYSFLTEATDREPVKFGIAILGLYQVPENVELFQTIGRHEEFTLFAAVALSRVSEDPEQALWTLAKNVQGWGRIQIVERIAETENRELKDWLLREGYKNSIMYEYLAYSCAVGGEMLAALSQDEIDRPLLTSIGEILSALISGGPAQDINDYDDGALAVEMFLGHLEPAAETLADFLTVQTIQSFLSYEEKDWDAAAERGWTPERRSALLAACKRILSRADWVTKAQAGLDAEDDFEFYKASNVARALGIDPWDAHWRRLVEKPTDSGRWYYVASSCDASQIDDVIALAEQTIDLKRIASGPADELGLGPEWDEHQRLDYLLQELGKFPGHGHRLIETALRSPVVRNRNMAINALAAWGQENWDDALKSVLAAASRNEPAPDVRERMEKVLRGESLSDY